LPPLFLVSRLLLHSTKAEFLLRGIIIIIIIIIPSPFVVMFPYGAVAPSGPRHPHDRGLAITDTPHSTAQDGSRLEHGNRLLSAVNRPGQTQNAEEKTDVTSGSFWPSGWLQSSAGALK
jgi:hypothetical protein